MAMDIRRGRYNDPTTLHARRPWWLLYYDEDDVVDTVASS